jgi:hypothetical protein
LLHNKYIEKKNRQVEEKPTNSPFWKGLMRVKKYFFFTTFFSSLGMVRSTVHFWKDIWLGGSPLTQQYPLPLYSTVQRKNIVVAKCPSPNSVEY